jgi:hypothetical protein
MPFSVRWGLLENQVNEKDQEDKEYRSRYGSDLRFDERAGLPGVTSSSQVPGENDRPQQQGAHPPP